MYEINNVNKRAMMIRHFVGYFLIALTILCLTIVIVFAANGYDIDRRTGQIIQNGIISIGSSPTGATVAINGIADTKTTPSNISLPVGQYELNLERDGYQSWQTDVEVVGSTVTELEYPRLVPDEIETTVVSRFRDVHFLEFDEQSDRLAANFGANPRSISLFELDQTSPIARPFAIPGALFAQIDEDEAVKLEYGSWLDGRYLLVWLTHDEQRDLLVLDLESRGRSVNITAESGVAFDRVIVTGDEVYPVQGTSLYGFSFESMDITPRLTARLGTTYDQSGLVSLIGRESTLYNPGNLAAPVLELDEAPGEVGLFDVGNQQVLALRVEDSVLVYQDYQYSSFGLGVADKIIRLGEPDEEVTMSLSPAGRFIAIKGATTSSVYDLASRRSYEVDYGDTDNLQWLDGYRMRHGSSDQLFIIDFNGSNNYQIASYDDSYGVTAQSSSRQIYSFDTATNGEVRLRSSQL